jgi:hypothetical protein
MENCKICSKIFSNYKALSTHFNLKHNFTSKKYYDMFLLKKDENKCVVCNKETSYRNINIGYLKNCSINCRDNNKQIKRDYWKNKKQSELTIKKRINNTNQINKEVNRKKTMLFKYGIDNPSKIKEFMDKVSKKLIGRKYKRSIDWQTKIINSKKKNGTTTHSLDTKEKIRISLNNFFSQNLNREKYMTKSNNKNHLGGWYKGIFFRSSLELSFLHNNSNKEYKSCENKEYAIEYVVDEKIKVYYPDFTYNNLIYEIKPTSLIKYGNNELKIKNAKKRYGDSYILITEKESPYITKKEIKKLIEEGVVVLAKNSENSLIKYRR